MEKSMNRKLLSTLMVLVALTFGTACYSGPKRLQRSWLDYENKAYVDNAWLTGALGVVPVYPFVQAIATIGDHFINFYYFWFVDAFDDNTGTAYLHENPSGARKTVSGPGF
jgi:hypothetical protein